MKTGDRILSAYKLNNNTKIWIITDACDDPFNRELTTILLPEDY